MSKVKVMTSESGQVIVVSENNAEFGHIRVIQEIIDFKDGWAKSGVISAFIPGPVEDLKKLNWVKDQQVDGKIIVKESLKPFNTKQPERDYKIAGKTGVICTLDGQPIYRKTMFTTDLDAKSKKIEHSNIEEIKNAFDAMNKAEALAAPAEEFAL